MPAAAPTSPDALLEHAAFVRTVARAALRGDDLVDDVVQETWVAALRDDGKRRGPLRAWLAGIARRQAANAIRRRVAWRRRDEKASRPEGAPSVVEVAERAELGGRLVAAVLALEEPYRTAVLLRYYDDLPPREIARRLGVPVETARTHVKRGLDRLRARMGADREDQRRRWLALITPSAAAPAFVTLLSAIGGLLVFKKTVLAAAVLLALALSLHVSGVFEGRSDRAAESAEAPPPAQPAVDASKPALEGRASEAAPAAHPGDRALAVGQSKTFRGLVVDPEGTPIPGVLVEVDLHASQLWRTSTELSAKVLGPAVTDAEGRVALRIAKPHIGSVAVRPRARGWVLAAVYGAGLSTEEEQRIVMVPACPIRVLLVEEETGRPVPGADVRSFTGIWTVAFNPLAGWPTDVATTDAAGRAEVGAPAGPARIVATAAGWAPVMWDGILASRAGTDLVLRMPNGGIVEGVVVDPSGLPAAGAEVRAFGPATYVATRKTDSEGRFRFEHVSAARPATYEALDLTHVVLRVEATGYPMRWHAVEAPGATEPRSTRIELQRGHALRGTVRYADGRSAPEGTRVTLTTDDLGAKRGYASTPTMNVALEDRVRFLFENLAPGVVEVAIRTPGEGEVQAKVEVPADKDPDVLEIVLDDRSEASLRVRVLDPDGKPLAGARVDAWRADDPNPPFSPPEALTDGDGWALLDRRPAVQTLLFVDPPGFAPTDLRVDLARPPANGITVRLGSGVIAGRAVRPDGSPARIALRLGRNLDFPSVNMGIHSRATKIETDESGAFRVRGVGDGEYGAQLDSPGLRLLSRAVRMQAGDSDVRLLVATEEEAARLFVEVEVLDAATLQPIEGRIQVSMQPAIGRGEYLMMLAVSATPGLYRASQPQAPGTYRVNASAPGRGDAGAIVELVWGQAPPRPRLLLERK